MKINKQNNEDTEFGGNKKVRVDLGGVKRRNRVNLVNKHCKHAYNLKELTRKYVFKGPGI